MWIRTNWLHLTYYTTGVCTIFENHRACKVVRLIFGCTWRVRFLGLPLRNPDGRWIYETSRSSPTYPNNTPLIRPVDLHTLCVYVYTHIHSSTAEVAINSDGFLYISAGYRPPAEEEEAVCSTRTTVRAAFT